MTDLFPIPVEGFGTRDVESLGSYLFRSAFGHGISVGQLLEHADMAFNRTHLTEVGSLSRSHSFNNVEISSKNKFTVSLTEILATLSGQDLSYSTTALFCSSLGRGRNEISKEISWCPACFFEWSIQRQQPYFKLIWQLEVVTHCPIHNIRLWHRCSACQAKQHSYIRHYDIIRCQRCGANLFLDRSTTNRQSYEYLESWLNESADLELLFEDIAHYGNREISYDGLRQSLDHLLDYYWKQDREKELFSVLPMNKLLCVIDGLKPITLPVARRFASQMGISLFDLFTGNAHQTSAVLNFDSYCSLPPLLDFSHRDKHNHDEVLKLIVQVREQHKREPISLKQFAFEVGVSIGYLEYRHPALCKRIVKDHYEYQQNQQNKVIQLAKIEAISYFRERKRSGEYISRKQAYKDLKEKTGIPKFKLRDAIQSAYSAIC